MHIIVVTEDDKSLTDNTRRFSRGRASASRIKLPTGGFAQWVGYKGVVGGGNKHTKAPDSRNLRALRENSEQFQRLLGWGGRARGREYTQRLGIKWLLRLSRCNSAH